MGSHFLYKILNRFSFCERFTISLPIKKSQVLKRQKAFLIEFSNDVYLFQVFIIDPKILSVWLSFGRQADRSPYEIDWFLKQKFPREFLVRSLLVCSKGCKIQQDSQSKTLGSPMPLKEDQISMRKAKNTKLIWWGIREHFSWSTGVHLTN